MTPLHQALLIGSHGRHALRRDTDRIEMTATNLADDATGTHNRSRLEHLVRRNRKPTRSVGAGHRVADSSERPGQLGDPAGRDV